MIIYAASEGIVRQEPHMLPPGEKISHVPFSKEILISKTCFLIDCYDTFLSMHTPVPHAASVRLGFIDFLQHYSAKVKIGIHSDGYPSEELREYSFFWGIDHLVDGFFGSDYCFFNDPDTGARIDYIPSAGYKHFRKMAADLCVPLKNTLVIGDGVSDEAPAIYAGIDLLLVPPYTQDGTFDFRKLC